MKLKNEQAHSITIAVAAATTTMSTTTVTGRGPSFLRYKRGRFQTSMVWPTVRKTKAGKRKMRRRSGRRRAGG